MMWASVYTVYVCIQTSDMPLGIHSVDSLLGKLTKSSHIQQPCKKSRF